MRVTKFFEAFGDHRAELQLDLFNVMNGLGNLLCSDDEFEADPSDGPCGWGRVTTVTGANRNILIANTFDAGDPDDETDDTIRYTVSQNFGTETVVGTGLLLQFQAQIGLKYYF